MNANELARLIEHWTDAMLLAELVQSPFLSVGDTWDLRDWEARDVPNGIRFQRHDAEGRVLEAVEAINAPASDSREYESILACWSIPTPLVMAGGMKSGAGTEKRPSLASAV